MTREQAVKLVTVALANWPARQNLDVAATAELWRQSLGDLPYEAVQAALMRHISSNSHWPTVAELRQAALDLLPRSDPIPSPEDAWAEVRRNLRTAGYYGTPTWSHPAIRRAAEALYGSWRDLCANSTADNASAERAHFMRLYESYVRHEREHAAMPPAVRELTAKLQNKALPEGGLGRAGSSG